MRALEKPVVAAVNGAAAGAGLSFACACDVRVAADNASFVPGFIGIGLVPDAGGSWFIHRLLGFARAFEWMTSNRRLSAQEALEWGLVSEVIPAADFGDAVAELAQRWAALPTRGVALTKRLFEHAHTADLEAQLALEAALQQARRRRPRTSRKEFAPSWRSDLRASAARRGSRPRAKEHLMSEQLDLEPAKPPHPIHLVVTDDLVRSRLTVFFRLLLVIPIAIWLALWAIAAFLVVIVAWFAGLFTGRVPDGLHRFLASFIRCSTHVTAYFLIAANPYPSFSGAPGYPVDVEIAGPVKQSRLTIFFRGILVDPRVHRLLRPLAGRPAGLHRVLVLRPVHGASSTEACRSSSVTASATRRRPRVLLPADTALPELLRRLSAPQEAPRVTGPIRTVDYHTGGEPFRIVTGGVEPLRGATILDKRRDALERLDHVRRLLVHEPRGHADMYGCHVVEPNDDGADLGVVFFHNAGYSTACGHGTIALVTWALDEGVVERREGENRVVVDVPSGRLETWATVADGRVRSVRFRNVPSFVWARGLSAAGRDGRRRLRRRVLRRACRACRGGRAASADRARTRDQAGARRGARDRAPARAGASRRLRRHVLAAGGARAVHPAQRDGVRRRRGRPLAVRQRHVGAARAARRRRDPANAAPCCGTSRSSGTEFRGRVVGDAEVAGLPAVVTEVEGSAYRTGTAEFSLDPADPLGDGFLLR